MVSCVGRSSLRRLSRRGGPDRLLEAPEVVSLVARSTMETLRKLLLAGAMLGAGAGVGTALFALVTPGEERKQAMLKVISSAFVRSLPFLLFLLPSLKNHPPGSLS